MSIASSDVGVSITFDGTTYTTTIDDLNGAETKAFREAVGMSPVQALGRGDVDLDVIAGFVWLSRRRLEPSLTYEAVSEAVTWRSVSFDTPAPAGEEAPDDPE